jgi:hypothetical protein
MDTKEPEKPIIPSVFEGKGTVSFPLTKDQFADFLSSMLGKPQSVSRIIRGAFEVGVPEIESIYRLLESRIHQQNDARLIQFTVKIVYSDESSVLLGSIQELQTYNEVRRVLVSAVHLNFRYLVKFQDKEHPEGQEIDVSMVSASGKPSRISGDEFPFVFISGLEGYFEFTIRYTGRTWATDIESLLSTELSGLLKLRSKTKDFLRKHESGVSGILAVFVIVCVLFGSFWTTNHVASRTMEILSKLGSPGQASTIEQLSQKIDQITDVVSSGFWAKHYFYVIVFIILGIAGGIFFGIWASSTLTMGDPSFILLTSESIKKRDAFLKKDKRRWTSFTLSVITSFVVGIASNIAFYYLVK